MAHDPAKIDPHRMTAERWKALKIYIVFVLVVTLGCSLAGALAFSLLQSLGWR
jgi:hypothetical protein